MVVAVVWYFAFLIVSGDNGDDNGDDEKDNVWMDVL
jgi:hypothetical protein